MQLLEFDVDQLFGRYHHRIRFPTATPEDPQPSLVILHGPNGVGKTTVLRMIDGFLRLDFNAFRENPFRTASLKFTTGDRIEVVAGKTDGRLQSLDVTFRNETVSLNPLKPGALKENDVPLV